MASGEGADADAEGFLTRRARSTRRGETGLFPGGPAAVDHQGAAGDHGGFVDGEIEGGTGEFLRSGPLRGGHFAAGGGGVGIFSETFLRPGGRAVLAEERTCGKAEPTADWARGKLGLRLASARWPGSVGLPLPAAVSAV